MVVKNNFLFENYERKTGFYSWVEYDFEKIILNNLEYMVRWEAEVDFDYKQPITYAVVINKDDKIFVYKRWWKNSNNWDARVFGKISIWVWWHLDKEDHFFENALKDWLLREVEEELWLIQKDIDSVDSIWFINNEEDDVNKVHIWAAYIIKINNDKVELLDWELEKWEFISVEKYEEMISSWNYDVENWSKILLEPLKEYLNKQKNLWNNT